MKILTAKSSVPFLLLSTFYFLLSLPLSASAQNITTITGLLGKARSILDAIVPFIIGLAVFVVIWGIFTYLMHAGEEEKRAEARQFILWGVIGVFFMLSIWGFVNILLNTFNVGQSIDASKIPHVPPIQGGDDNGIQGG